MKRSLTVLVLVIHCAFNFQLSTAQAQGTAFTYQGRLNDGGNPANGNYDLAFSVFSQASGGNPVALPFTNTATAVSNGVFNVTLDFGGIFTGTNYWLDVSVRTNGNGTFFDLAPRQAITPTPYAVMANSASNLLGALPVTQLSAGTAGISITGSAASVTGSFAGDVTGTQSATAVSKVGGVTAANVASGANAANAASTGNIANTIVKRDGNGSIVAIGLSLDDTLAFSSSTVSIFSGTGPIMRASDNGNFFAGLDAGNQASTAVQNTGIGAGALSQDTSGGGNVALGDSALGANTSGGRNAALGFEALNDNSTGSSNIAVGFQTLFNLESGAGNIGLGYSALPNLTTGSGNIGIGISAGSAIFSGNNNIDIGNSGFGDESGVIRIGTAGVHTKAVMLGIFGTTVGGGAAVQVNSSGLLGTVTSSRRFKQNIQSMADASDVLLALHPVTFQYKPELDPDATPQFGLIAEDVEKVDPALVLHDDKHQIYTVRYEAVNAMLLNEFLKEHQQVEKQNTEIQDLKQSVAELKELVQSMAGKK